MQAESYSVCSEIGVMTARQRQAMKCTSNPKIYPQLTKDHSSDRKWLSSKQPNTRAGKVNHYLAAGSDLCVDKYQIGQETVKLWGGEREARRFMTQEETGRIPQWPSTSSPVWSHSVLLALIALVKKLLPHSFLMYSKKIMESTVQAQDPPKWMLPDTRFKHHRNTSEDQGCGCWWMILR